MGRVLIIGDSCRDIYIYGRCDRLCPDAPVPVLIPTKTIENGGMAMNVFDNVKSIHENVDIITNKELITKTRYVDEKTNQMLVRVDSDKSSVDKLKDLMSIRLQDYDVIIISDYCKGFIGVEEIKWLCNNHKNVFIDTKKILGDYCLNAKIIKINKLEYDNNVKAHVDMSKFNHNLIVTIGSKGCNYEGIIYPVEKVDIKDMTGAGDTFMATLVVKYLECGDITKAIEFANDCATIIVQHKGVNKIGDFI